jgi:ribosomal protein S18 acetylase RimI-like enzyme
MEIIDIREAVLTDVDDLQELYAHVDQIHHDEYPEIFKSSININRPTSFFESIFSDDNIKFLVACIDNQIIGFIHAELKKTNHPVLQKYFYGHVSDIVIRPDYKRTGVGSKLFKSVEIWFKENKVNEISLTVFNFNEEAINFYEKTGFNNRHCTMTKKIEYSEI